MVYANTAVDGPFLFRCFFYLLGFQDE